MKVVVIGGSGLVGAKLVTPLSGSGHDALAASLATGVNTVAGVGLAKALVSARAVADVTNSSSVDAGEVMTFFETSARNIVASSLAASVGHLVVLSVVGADRLIDSAYFRAKMAQENAVRTSAVPCTIVRATQFFEFAEGIAQAATHGDVVRVPAATVQPIASRDVAAALAEIIVGPPVCGIVEVAGPDRMPLADFIRRSLEARRDRRAVIQDPRARYFGATPGADTLTPGRGSRVGELHLADWLRARAARN
jgi:uncharacterized protein YbjT (DUF2867 family)